MAQDHVRDRTQQQARADMRESGMPQGQAPARVDQGQQRQQQQQEQRQNLTAAQKAARDRYAMKDRMLAAALENRPMIERSLHAQGIAWDDFMAALEVGLTQTMRNDEDFFTKVPIQSFLEAVVKAAHLGLKPDGKEGAIVRYANGASFLPMVEGFVKKLWKTGAVKDINHNVVREGDHFDYEEGDDGFVRHKRPLKRVANAETIGAWCVINLVTGGKIIEICDQKDLQDIAKVSRATKGPRDVWEGEMHRKAPFRRATKRMPKDEGLRDLLAVDDGHYNLAAPRYDMLDDSQRRARVARGMSDDELFDDKRAELPKDDPTESKPAEDQVTDQTADEDEEVDDETMAEAQAHVTEILHTTSVAGLLEIVEIIDQRATEEAFSEEALGWLAETVRNRITHFGITQPEPGKSFAEWLRGALGQDEPASDEGEKEETGDQETEADETPALRAVLSKERGLQVWTDPELWKSDILAKLSTLNAQLAGAFWKVNRIHVVWAAAHGHEAHAEKILKVARERGLEREADRE